MTRPVVGAARQRPVIRWIARKPPVPGGPPRPTFPPRDPRTPRYRRNPGWGLEQRFAPPGTEPVDPGAPPPLPTRALRVATALLAAAGLAELIRFGLILRNRHHLLPGFVTTGSDALIWLTSLGALFAVLSGGIAAGRWMVQARARIHSQRALIDPRPPRHVLLGMALPVVNLVTAPVLVSEWLSLRIGAEAGEHRDDAEHARQRRWLWMWWAGFAALHLLALAAVVVRIVAGKSTGALAWIIDGSGFAELGAQTQANLTELTAVTYLTGAAFLLGTIALLRRMSTAAARREAETEHRWVIAA